MRPAILGCGGWDSWSCWGWCYCPFPNPYVKVLGLTTMVLCLLEIRRLRYDPRGWIIPGLAAAALGLKLFDLTVIGIAVTMVVPIAALLAGYDRSRWREVVLGSLASLWLFLFIVTFLDRPGVLGGALAAAPISMAASTAQGGVRRPVCCSGPC